MTYPTAYPSSVSEFPEDTKYIVLVNDQYAEAGYYKEDPSITKKYVRTLCFSTDIELQAYIESETKYAQYKVTKDPSDIIILPYNKRINIVIETKIIFNC